MFVSCFMECLLHALVHRIWISFGPLWYEKFSAFIGLLTYLIDNSLQKNHSDDRQNPVFYLSNTFTKCHFVFAYV